MDFLQAFDRVRNGALVRRDVWPRDHYMRLGAHGDEPVLEVVSPSGVRLMYMLYAPDVLSADWHEYVSPEKNRATH